VVNRVVFRELLAELRLSGGLIGHDVSFAGYISANDWRDVLFLDGIDMERTSRATALNESHDYTLVIFLCLTSTPCLRPMKVSSTSTIEPLPP
jgi:hypothetical protein